MNPQTNKDDQVKAKVWALVDALPHRGAILESDARGWVDEVVGLHGEAAIWHAVRLNGFGGSEIGVLVRNHAGVRADHQASAHDIVAGKLMRKAPTESSGHMTRGHENEEPHARRFYTKYGATRDLVAFEALKAAQGKRKWMRYSPDDIVQMPVSLETDVSGAIYPSMRNGQMRRWLIDYKAPSKVEQSEEIAFQYAAQLAQGAILCAENDIELDGMMLSQFDWANWLLKDDVVLWDESLGMQVLRAGDFYWDYVLKGTVPDYIRTLEMDGVEAYSKDYLAAAEMFANLSALSDASKKRADEIRETILSPMAGKRLAGKKISFGIGESVLTLGAKQMLDRDAAKKLLSPQQLDECSGAATYELKTVVDHLRSLGTNMTPFRVYDLDATKVYAAAEASGLDPDALVAEQLTLTTSKTVKAQMAAYINEHYPLSAALVGRETDVGEEETQAVQEQVPVG